MASEDTGEQKVGLRKIFIPVAIGVSISLYLIISNFNPGDLSTIHFTDRLCYGLILALLAVAIRDFAFMYKIRLSSGVQGSWFKTLQTIIMWEFGAAISPKISEVAFILFVLKKTGISYGRSTAVIVLNTFLDNLLFVFVFGILYLFLGQQMFSFSTPCDSLAGHPVMEGARKLASYGWVLGFIGFVVVAAVFGIGLIFLPHAARKFFYWLGDLRFLNRIKDSLTHLGDEIEITAREYKNRETSFWVKMILATWVNWTARYLLANALLFGFSDGNLNMTEVFSRQYIIWIFLAIPSTPGASGVAEIGFIALNCEFMPVDYKMKVAIAVIWRIFSYYLYLLLGMIVLPRWAKLSVKG